eukprot:Colp12_sorted_trinity150504_noHs@28167
MTTIIMVADDPQIEEGILLDLLFPAFATHRKFANLGMDHPLDDKILKMIGGAVILLRPEDLPLNSDPLNRYLPVCAKYAGFLDTMHGNARAKMRLLLREITTEQTSQLMLHLP